MIALARPTPMTEHAVGHWQLASDEALVAHLLERYHAEHRRQLPELVDLARRVELVHLEHDECPRGLADHLGTMAQALESHMRKEEVVLFPLLLAGRGAAAQMPIGVMRREHEHHMDDLRRVATLCHHGVLPHDACHTWRTLYERLDAFCRDLQAHVRLENDVLFTRHARP